MPKASRISEYEKERIRQVAWHWHAIRGSRPTALQLAGELPQLSTWMPFAQGGEGYPPRSVEACKRILADIDFPVLDPNELWSLADTDNQALGIPDDATGFLLELNEYAFVRGYRFTKLQAKYASKLRWSNQFRNRDPHFHGHIAYARFDIFFLTCAIYAGLEKDNVSSKGTDLSIQLDPVAYQLGKGFGWIEGRSWDESTSSVARIDPHLMRDVNRGISIEAKSHADSILTVYGLLHDYERHAAAAANIYNLWVTMFNRIQSNAPQLEKRQAEHLMAQEIVTMLNRGEWVFVDHPLKFPTQYFPSQGVLKRLNISSKSIRKVIEDDKKKNTQSN